MSNTFKQPQYRDATMSLSNTFSKSTFRVIGDNNTNYYRYPPAALTSNTSTLSGNAYGNGTYTVTFSASRNEESKVYRTFDYVDDHIGGWQLTSPAANTAPGGYNYAGVSTLTTNDATPITYSNMEWIQISMPQSFTLSRYGIYSWVANEPKTWAILGSNNGTQWYTLSQYDVGSNVSVIQFNTVYVDLTNNKIAYSQYRFVYLTSFGEYPSVRQIKFYGYTADSLCIGLWGDTVGNNSYGYVQTIINSPETSQEWPLLLNPNGGNVSIGNINPIANLHIKGGVQNNSAESINIYPIRDTAPVLLLDATKQNLGNTKGYCMPIFTSRSYVDNTSFLNIYNYRWDNNSGSTNTGWLTASTRIQQTIDITNMSYIEFNPQNANGGIGIYGNYSANLNASGNGITVNQNGLVGIGTTSPTTLLHIVQPGTATGQSTAIITAPNGACNAATNWPNGWSGGLRTFDMIVAAIKTYNGTIFASDIRLKTNIETYKRSTSEVMQLRPVSFIWKDSPNKGTQYGFIAQELEQIIPELIVEGSDGFKSIKKGMDAILVNCIQENQKIIETLQTENQGLKAQLSKILSILTVLEK